jgi:hypothetical protein
MSMLVILLVFYMYIGFIKCSVDHSVLHIYWICRFSVNYKINHSMYKSTRTPT